MQKDQIMGIAASTMLVIGSFLPMISVPFLGTINYFQNGKGDGVIIVILGLVVLVLSLTNNSKYNIVPGLLAACALAFTYFNFQSKLGAMKDEISGKDLGMFQGIADATMQNISIEYGFAVIAMGGIFAFTSGIVAEPKPATNNSTDKTGDYFDIIKQLIALAVIFIVAWWVMTSLK